MIGTTREIITELLKCSDLDSQKVVFAMWDRDDIRCTCLDWNLTDDELDEVLKRLNANLECRADIGQIHSIVETLLDERREKRCVTIPAASLEIIMRLAGSELTRIEDNLPQGAGTTAPRLIQEKGIMNSLRIVLDA